MSLLFNSNSHEVICNFLNFNRKMNNCIVFYMFGAFLFWSVTRPTQKKNFFLIVYSDIYTFSILLVARMNEIQTNAQTFTI